MCMHASSVLVAMSLCVMHPPNDEGWLRCEDLSGYGHCAGWSNGQSFWRVSEA